jgi:hypothetical protein
MNKLNQTESATLSILSFLASFSAFNGGSVCWNQAAHLIHFYESVEVNGCGKTMFLSIL